MEGNSERARLTEAISGTRFRQLRWVSETGSTNDDLLRDAKKGGPEQVLVADLQTAGRGRRDRTWHSPSETALLMSLLIRSGESPLSPFWTIGAVALAAADAVSARIDTTCGLKWPNDLLIAESKVAGILAQVVDDAVIVGIGLNMNWSDERPPGVPDHATALSHHCAAGWVDRESFVAEFVVRADSLLGLSGQDVRTRWVQACVTIGNDVRVEMVGHDLFGRAVGVDDDGALLVQPAEPAGSSERSPAPVAVQVGDVIHLRTRPWAD